MNDAGIMSGLVIGLVVIVAERILSAAASYFQSKNENEKTMNETLIRYGERFSILSDKVDSIVRLKDDYNILFRRLEKLEDKFDHRIDQIE